MSELVRRSDVQPGGSFTGAESGKPAPLGYASSINTADAEPTRYAPVPRRPAVLTEVPTPAAKEVTEAKPEKTPIDPKSKRITTVRHDHGSDDVAELDEFHGLVAGAVDRVRAVDPDGKVGVHVESADGTLLLAARVRQLVGDKKNPLAPSEAYLRAVTEKLYPGIDSGAEEAEPMRKVAESKLNTYGYERMKVLARLPLGSIDIFLEFHNDPNVTETLAQGEQPGIRDFFVATASGAEMTDQDCDAARAGIDRNLRAIMPRDYANANTTAGHAADDKIYEIVTLDGTSHDRALPLVLGGYNVVDQPIGAANHISPFGSLLRTRRANTSVPLTNRDIRLAAAAYRLPRIEGESYADRNKRMASWIEAQ